MSDPKTIGNVKIILMGVVIVTVIDVCGSLISRTAHIPYAWFGIATFLTYVTLGYRGARDRSLLAIAVIGLIVCTFDATVGWAVSALLGPGRVPSSGAAHKIAIVVTTVTSVGTGTLIWLASAISFKYLHRGSTPSSTS